MAERRRLVVAYDVGTTSLKTCVYNIAGKLELLAGASAGYELAIFGDGCAEQDPGDWLKAMAETTSRVLDESGIRPEEIEGLSFCSQMQGLVLVDAAGNSLRPAMSYMDGRAAAQKRSCGSRTLPVGPKIEGLPAAKLLRSIQLTGIAPTSVKDPLWKYHWVRENEPDTFAKIDKYLDVKEFLILKLTGRAVMTRDSACATFLYDNRAGRGCWSRALCAAYGVNHEHLPK